RSELSRRVVAQPVVVDSNAVLRRMGLLFLMRMRRLIAVPVVVCLSIKMRVARIVVLLALVCMLVRVPEAVLVRVGHRLALCTWQ
ncbi:hypothetical protein LCGC14_3076000, partial [marine sediment metagenome]